MISDEASSQKLRSEEMKIEIGKRYKMRNYPADYKYVHIVCTSDSIGLATFRDTKEYLGVIVYNFKPLGNTPKPDFCYWGENGNWDNGKVIDRNDLVEEYAE